MFDKDLKRTIEDITLLYELEPETKDVYVEGITDKLILDRFLRKNNLEDIKVFQVHEIDFSLLSKSNPDIKSNNKKKLLALNMYLEKQFLDPLKGISIVIDQDIDGISNRLSIGTYLNYTDYHSLEIYLYNANTIDIFYKNHLHGFPVDGQQTIKVLEPILIEKFLVRSTVNKDGLIKLTPFEKSIKIDKAKHEISFDAENHIFKTLNSVKLAKQKDGYVNFYKVLKDSFNGNPKLVIRGHDFVELFFLWIDKIKNDIKLTCDSMERALFQCIDYSQLKKETLFSNLLGKYS